MTGESIINPFGPATAKKVYKSGVSISENLSGKTAREAQDRAANDQAKANAAAEAAALANEQAALVKGQESQREALKRKGRRASILTSPTGIQDQPLGVPGSLS